MLGFFPLAASMASLAVRATGPSVSFGSEEAGSKPAFFSLLASVLTAPSQDSPARARSLPLKLGETRLCQQLAPGSLSCSCWQLE